MAQLLLIKTEDIERRKKPGDIIGVFEDSHKFSEKEIEVFNIEYVANLTKTQTEKAIPRYALETGYISKVANQWTLEKPLHRLFWKDENGRFWFYDVEVKYHRNYYSLKIEERKDLESEIITYNQRIELLKKCSNRLKDYPENNVEAIDLNG